MAIKYNYSHYNIDKRELIMAIESSYDGIWICDGEGNTLLVNEAVERITGLSKENVIGKNMKSLVDKGVFNQSATLEVIKKRETVTLILAVVTGITTIVTGTPIFDEQGQIKSIVTNVRDITELVNLQEKLEEQEEETMRYKSELAELRDQYKPFEQIVAKSTKMQEIIESVYRVAKYETTVLILGETGVGKEVIAQLIHDTSPRKKKGKLIRLNCSAIPENLFESELFGYEKGAFTGASSEGKPGMFELANNGTLFLDEIGELSPPIQAKLLRVIQEKEVTRLGGVKPIKINVRLIAATNRDLKQMMKKGDFRSDLFYRLNVVQYIIPPIRERKEDVIALIHLFIKQFNNEYNEDKRISSGAINMLLEYDWPGNIRELRNIIERMYISCSSNSIGINDLPSFFHKVPNTNEYKFNLKPLKEQVEEFEMNLIKSVMDESKTTYEAAEKLGVNQSTISRKLNQYRQNV